MTHFVFTPDYLSDAYNFGWLWPPKSKDIHYRRVVAVFYASSIRRRSLRWKATGHWW